MTQLSLRRRTSARRNAASSGFRCLLKATGTESFTPSARCRCRRCIRWIVLSLGFVPPVLAAPLSAAAPPTVRSFLGVSAVAISAINRRTAAAAAAAVAAVAAAAVNSNPTLMLLSSEERNKSEGREEEST